MENRTFVKSLSFLMCPHTIKCTHASPLPSWSLFRQNKPFIAVWELRSEDQERKGQHTLLQCRGRAGVWLPVSARSGGPGCPQTCTSANFKSLQGTDHWTRPREQDSQRFEPPMPTLWPLLRTHMPKLCVPRPLVQVGIFHFL